MFSGTGTKALLAAAAILMLLAGVIYAATPPIDYCANAQCRIPREFCGWEC